MAETTYVARSRVIKIEGETSKSYTKNFNIATGEASLAAILVNKYNNFLDFDDAEGYKVTTEPLELD